MTDIAEAVLEGTLKGKEACLKFTKKNAKYAWTRKEQNNIKKQVYDLTIEIKTIKKIMAMIAEEKQSREHLGLPTEKGENAK